VVDKASDLDVAAVLGMGFPAYRGGLLHWADAEGGGARRVAAVLDALAQAVGGKTAGFFAPCSALRRAADRGLKLGSLAPDGGEGARM